MKGLASRPRVAIMSDEIYDQMVYDGEEHVCLLSYPEIRDRTILLNGWSKTYAMTGWRLGYSIWPGKLYDAARKLAVNSFSCVNAPAQWAALEALTGPQDAVASMVAEFDRRRKAVVAGLNALPNVTCATPKGAFYAFPEHFEDRLEGEAARLRPARGCRRRDHRRAGLRRAWRGLYPAQLRQQPREHREGAEAHAGLPGAPQRGVSETVTPGHHGRGMTVLHPAVLSAEDDRSCGR